MRFFKMLRGRCLLSIIFLMILLTLLGCQEPVSQAGFTNDQKSLPEPFDIFPSPASNESLPLSWGPSKNALGHKVLLRKKNETQFQTVATLPAVERSYVITNLLYGVDYRIKVSAFNHLGSIESEEILLMLTPEPPVLDYLGLNAASGYVGRPLNLVPSLLDENGSPITECSILPSLPPELSIHNTTCAISGTPSTPMGLQSYVITAKNSMGSGRSTLFLSVFPSPPVLSFQGTSGITGLAGSPMSISPVSLLNNGGPITLCTSNPPLPGGLSVNPSTCVISGTPTVSAPLTTYMITATNSAGFNRDEVTFSISPSPPVLSYIGALGTNGNHSSSMNVSPTTLINNGSPITSCRSFPDLPQGLSLDPLTCVISGTPLEITSTTFTITATNSMGTSSSLVTLIISPSIPRVSFSGVTSTTGSFGQSMSVAPTTLNSNGASITNCTTSPALPVGLFINPSTCVIQGVPQEILSPQSYTVMASNSAGNGTGEVTLQVTASSPILSFSGALGTSGLVGIAMNIIPTTLNLRGGELLSCETSPSLPLGLEISDATCVISGTPSEVLSGGPFTVTASNSEGFSSATLSINISPSPPLLSFDGAQGTHGGVGNVMSISPSTLNHRGAIISECTITPSLPQGLSINSSCLIGGIPWEVSPETSYTVTASNSAGSVSSEVTLTVSPSNPILSYAGSSGKNGKVQEPMSINPMTFNTGGTLIQSCTSSPELPSGLTINSSTCVISGTPQGVLNSTSFTITATNSAGSGTSNVILSVSPNSPRLSFFNATGAQGFFGQEMRISPTLLEERGSSITNCTTTPGLPDGLSIDPMTCVISGVPGEILPETTFNVKVENSADQSTELLSLSVSGGTLSFTEDSAAQIIPIHLPGANPGASCSPLSFSISSQVTATVSGVHPDCVVSVIPKSNQNGTGTLIVYLNGIPTLTTTLDFSISGVDDAPVTTSVSQSINEDNTTLITLNYLDQENDGATTCELTTLTNLTGTCSCSSGICKASVSGTENYSGSAGFSYTVTANGLISNSSTASITIIGVDDAPVASNVSSNFAEDSSEQISLPFSDVEGDPATSCEIIFPSLSSLTGSCICTLGHCEASVSSSSNFDGSGSFTYTITANGLTSNSASGLVTVFAVNDAPVLSAFSGQSTNEDTSLSVAFNVTDVDSSISCSDFISATSSNTPLIPDTEITSHGTAPDCTLSLTPALNQNGTSTITVIASDGSLSDTKNFTLTVNAINDAPVISAIANQITNEDTLKVLNFTISDVDSTVNCISSVAVTSTTPVSSVTKGGTAPTCALTVVPISDHSGVSNMDVTVSDGSLSASTSFTFTVTALDDNPVVTNVSGTISEDVTGSIILNYTDVDGDKASICTLSSLSHLTGTCNCDSSIGACTASVTGTLNYNGPATFSYTVTSNGATSNTATASVTVTPVNDAPTIGVISNQSSTTGTAVVLSITPSDVDSSLNCNTSITLTSSDTTVLPLASISKTGTFPNCSLTLTPSTSPGSTSVSVTVSDGFLSSSQSFTLTTTSSFIKHRKLASREWYTCALNNQGAVKCWGYGATTSWTASTVTGLTSDIVSIDVGLGHACALTSAGGVKCWGWNNSYGQLGDGSTTGSSTPVNVSGLSSGVAAIGVGDYHSCAVMTSGAVKCWGYNNRGQVGNGSYTNALTPVDVSGLNSGVALVDGGGDHTCAVLSIGGMKCWGFAENGQLGNNSINPPRRNAPVDVTGLSSVINQISLGKTHTCALLSSGGVKCWGSNINGRLGNGTTTTSLIPSDVNGLSSGISYIATGVNSVCAVTTSGAAKCWGSNCNPNYVNNYPGKIGIGDSNCTDYSSPQDVTLITSGIQEISTGDNASFALMSTEIVSAWGTESEGDLGGALTSITSATTIPNVP